MAVVEFAVSMARVLFSVAMGAHRLQGILCKTR
jgi:hypothetical protein